jgi:hypothetical protein
MSVRRKYRAPTNRLARKRESTRCESRGTTARSRIARRTIGTLAERLARRNWATRVGHCCSTSSARGRWCTGLGILSGRRRLPGRAKLCRDTAGPLFLGRQGCALRRNRNERAERFRRKRRRQLAREVPSCQQVYRGGHRSGTLTIPPVERRRSSVGYCNTVPSSAATPSARVACVDPIRTALGLAIVPGAQSLPYAIKEAGLGRIRGTGLAKDARVPAADCVHSRFERQGHAAPPFRSRARRL